ncbi:MAG: hypothetical protein ABJG88_00675 [Litorimonas sp.]
MPILHFSHTLFATFAVFFLMLGLQGCKSKSLGLNVESEVGVVTILGEFHGTQEISSILNETVATSKLRGPVAIGLEVPNCALSRAIPNNLLLSLPGDNERPCDYSGMVEGRISSGLVATLNNLLADKTIKVFGIENGHGRANDDWDSNVWEGLVANRIEAVASEGYEVVVVTGNLHARKGNYTFGGQTTTAFAARLSTKSISVLIVPRKAGEAFMCASVGDCKKNTVPASSQALATDGMNCDVDTKNFDCVYTVPTYTASKPLVPQVWKTEH